MSHQGGACVLSHVIFALLLAVWTLEFKVNMSMMPIKDNYTVLYQWELPCYTHDNLSC